MNEGFLITKNFDEVRQQEYDQYNEKCRQDLQQMNETKIDNLIARGGTEGWETIGDLDALTKTFEFDSFERANLFVQAVGRFAETKDHHPEWQLVNGGRSVSVRLTSHFANNKVTLFDFELAEAMNQEYKSSLKTSLFPRYSQSQLISVAVGLGSVVFLLGTYQYLTRNRHYTSIGQLLDNQAPLHQLPGESAENHSGFRTTEVFKTQKKLFP